MTSCMYFVATSGQMGQEGAPVPQEMVLLMVAISSCLGLGFMGLREGKNLLITSSVDFCCGAKLFHFRRQTVNRLKC